MTGAAAGADPRVQPMTVRDLDEVTAIEQQAYAFPWTRGNFIDSLSSGHPAWTLRAAQGGPLLAYYVAMEGVEEMHLLNITVAPAEQGRGHARALLAHLADQARALRALQLWLEVRESNARALQLYLRHGFETVGRRKGYYPAVQGREDAIVMRLPLSDPEGDGHAVD